jgi:hypothetical protein
MKKRLFFISLVLVMTTLVVQAQQDTIVAWTFPATSADSLTDVAISLNSSRYISCQYGTSGSTSYYAVPIDYSTYGSLGNPDKCAKTTGWNNAVDSMYYMVKFKTTGYANLKLYSKQQGGGTNPGPRDFKVQYKLSGSNVWNDIPGGTIVCANNWTSGVLNGIDLPVACNNSTNQISIRWLITSNLDINGNALLSTGISKIDDIVVMGSLSTGLSDAAIDTDISIYPNPCSNMLNINSAKNIVNTEIYNVLGEKVYSSTDNSNDLKVNVDQFDSGLYLVILHLRNDSKVVTRKVLVQ